MSCLSDARDNSNPFRNLMIHPFSADGKALDTAYLAVHQIPALSFEGEDLPFPSLAPIWRAMRTENPQQALRLAQSEIDSGRTICDEERAALLVSLAAAHLAMGANDRAKKYACRSLDLFANQWAGHRIMLRVLSANRSYQAAYLHLANIHHDAGPKWDERLSNAEYHTALAGWAWRLGEWEQVAKHIYLGYPYGLDTMPKEIQEDWFRLALYRDKPDDAVAVATVLIKKRSTQKADELLQTFVKNGWTGEALPLYRSAYNRDPGSQLLRRRLVALCIKEGELEEARRLTAPGALHLAA